MLSVDNLAGGYFQNSLTSHQRVCLSDMARPVLLLILFILLLPAIVCAKPSKGFHEGPYLRIIGGLAATEFDNNPRTGDNQGGDYQGCFGFQFGWNLWDSTAAELEGRYSTKKIRDNREHLVNINLNIKYSFIVNGLTDLGGFHILPFVQGGPAALIAAVPGDPASNDRIIGVYGGGFGGGTGVDFLIKQYIHFGIFIQADVYYINPVNQTIGGRSQRVIKGGWEPQWGILGAAGVHF